MLEETVTNQRHLQCQCRNMHSNWKSPSCLVETVQQDELEARAHHVETSEGVTNEFRHRAGISGRRQSPAKNATRRGAQVSNAIRRGGRGRALEVDGLNIGVVLHAGAALV